MDHEDDPRLSFLEQKGVLQPHNLLERLRVEKKQETIFVTMFGQVVDGILRLRRRWADEEDYGRECFGNGAESTSDRPPGGF